MTMNLPRRTSLAVCLLLATTSSTYAVGLNTDCDVGPTALEEDVMMLAASVPQVCFPHVEGDGVERERCFYLLLPDCAKQTQQGVPLVVDLHDTGSCPLEQSRTSGWRDFALSDCFAVAWPMGTTDSEVTDEPCFSVPGGMETVNGNGMTIGTAPDCCCTKEDKLISANTTNDVNFIREVISLSVDTAAASGIHVRTTSIHMTGYGKGATAALGYTALNSQSVACATSFSGPMVTQFPYGYQPVPLFTVLDSGTPHQDEDVAADWTSWSGGDDSYLIPSASRTDGFFASANHCGAGTSQSNEAVDEITGEKGLVTGGRFNDCQAAVNFVKPPFASYKARAATTDWPVNRVVDTTGLALYFCRDKLSPQPTYTGRLRSGSADPLWGLIVSSGVVALLSSLALAI